MAKWVASCSRFSCEAFLEQITSFEVEPMPLKKPETVRLSFARPFMTSFSCIMTLN